MRMKDTKIKGFGVEYDVQTWARMIEVSVSSFADLVKSGRTMEEIFAFFRKEFKPITRKPREGVRMAETRQLVADLLKRSGYDVAPKDLTVRAIPNAEHIVSFEKRRIGVYNYKTGWLGRLADGNALPLKEDYSERLKVTQRPDGGWIRTAESAAIIARLRTAGEGEIRAEEYHALLSKYDKEGKSR